MIVSVFMRSLVTFANSFSEGYCVDKQKLSLQKKIDKACTENVELQAEKLALMERTFWLYEKCHAFLFCELCLCKQLGVLSEKKKKMFARELAFIKNLKRLKQEAFENVKLSNAVKVS